MVVGHEQGTSIQPHYWEAQENSYIRLKKLKPFCKLTHKF